ncbi:MAG TPA: hypothetical protein GX702_15160 [Chloroflexi bacterium]|jgi:hypothetical protein|nr:hypothetical protein [Chloroflexota bacterium]
MTDQEMTMNAPEQRATGRVVEVEIRLPRREEIEMPKVNLEPVRNAVGQVLLTGIGVSILLARGITGAVRAAYRAGTDAAQEPGTLAHSLMGMMQGDKKTGPIGEIKRVPVLPIADYDTLSAEEIIDRIKGLDEEQLRTLRDYEAAHEQRTVVLTAIDSQLGAA